MRTFDLPACLITLAALLAGHAYAADPPAAQPAPPPPPQWEHAIPVTVLIGGDVSVGVETQLSPAPLLFKLDDPKRLHDAGSKAVECVVDAEASGNLAAERLSIRLLTIRCFDAEGGVTFNKAIHGYVEDIDARAGAKGNTAWSQAAKELTMLGVGTQSRQNYIVRGAQNALNRVTFGIGEGLFSKDEEKNGPPPETIRDLRSADTLLPVLTLEPGRKLRIVITSGAQ